jgi:hypothetical protein
MLDVKTDGLVAVAATVDAQASKISANAPANPTVKVISDRLNMIQLLPLPQQT